MLYQSQAEIFFTQEQGLFPTPKAIGFHCSCPDSASMCKHVAATLYGIGARFDEDPSLFFTLRGADTGDLIAETIQDETDELLTRTKRKSAKVIDDADLADIFGIDMDNMPDFIGNGEKQPVKEKLLQRNQVVRKGGNPDRLAASQKKRKNIPQPPKTASDRVAAIITAGTAGVTIADLLVQTGFPKSKLYGIVHKLKQEGKIKNASYGVYVKT